MPVALPTNIGLGRKGFPGTNALAYLDNIVKKKKSFLTSTPGQKIIGFSIYGSVNSTLVIDKGYFEGIEENLKLLPIYYPGN
jgi:hypothetical protein